MNHKDNISATATSSEEPITAPAMEHSLRQALAPTELQVLDESHAHAGHAMARLAQVAPLQRRQHAMYKAGRSY